MISCSTCSRALDLRTLLAVTTAAAVAAATKSQPSQPMTRPLAKAGVSSSSAMAALVLQRQQRPQCQLLR